MDAFGIATVFALLVMFVASLFISFHFQLSGSASGLVARQNFTITARRGFPGRFALARRWRGRHVELAPEFRIP